MELQTVFDGAAMRTYAYAHVTFITLQGYHFWFATSAMFAACILAMQVSVSGSLEVRCPKERPACTADDAKSLQTAQLPADVR
jgi:hypothetical protein